MAGECGLREVEFGYLSLSSRDSQWARVSMGERGKKSVVVSIYSDTWGRMRVTERSVR